MKKIAILTSGGDSPGMNPAIRAVVRTCIYNNVQIFGVKFGYDGLIKGNLFEMNVSSVADIIQKGGTMLGSARSKEFMTEEGLKKAINTLKIFGIEGLIVLGGDGTFRGANILSKNGIKTIAIPCTIDNDMGYTDYTIGFFTSINTVTDAITKLRDTSSSHGRANILEVMGRKCGDIALYSGISGGAESIIVPEMELDLEKICNKIISGRKRGKLHHIIVLTEGILSPYELKKQIEAKTNIDTRVTVLGHIQRGGTPSSFDRIMASQMGSKAVKLLLEDKTDLALAFKNNEIVSVPISKAVSIKREFNKNLYEIADELSI
ncbi:MAG: 6-phosphofructokinase [Parvimonas sp.]|uniref:6-phosphofructokinase n=1 Tax=Parvimonas sp. TaxID=1944660 RepID=UPI0025CF5423|nr:6-phosphofructokinase [Parvimonas sp.]MCI5997796.1 6-phosphofructokinase [Parvimonas sp.]